MTTIREGTEPEIILTDERASARLLLSDGTDATWRRIYNRLALTCGDGVIPAEAMGSGGSAVVVVSVRRAAGPGALVDAVGRACELITTTDDEFDRRSHDDSPFRDAVGKWWLDWKTTNRDS